MNVDASAVDFRAEMRSWIHRHAPKGLADVFDWRNPRIVGNRDERRGLAMTLPVYREWERRFLDENLVCPSWPVEYGGRGWTRAHRAAFEAELHAAGLPRIDRDLGESLVGPTVIAWGTDPQKERFLAPIIRGEHRYCQGFSEPDSGSDLASLKTRGVVDGDELVINGQKVWTTHAHDANMMIVLCRTDPGEARHRGITFVIAPFTPVNGVDVRPLRQMSGPAEFAEVFLNDMRADLADVIGGMGNGWSVAMTTLAEERDFNIPTLALENLHEFWTLVDTTRERGRSVDPVVRQHLAQLFTTASIMQYISGRVLADPTGARTQAVIGIIKLLWSEHHRRFADRAVEIDGAAALLRPPGADYDTSNWQDVLLASQAETIFAGTSEIQRNMIAERLLGLPK